MKPYRNSFVKFGKMHLFFYIFYYIIYMLSFQEQDKNTHLFFQLKLKNYALQ